MPRASLPESRARRRVRQRHGPASTEDATFLASTRVGQGGAAGRPARSYRSDERTMRDPRAERAAIADLLDLQEGRLGVPLLDDVGIRTLLASEPRIAMVGASNDPRRPSSGVFRDLRAA